MYGNIKRALQITNNQVEMPGCFCLSPVARRVDFTVGHSDTLISFTRTMRISPPQLLSSHIQYAFKLAAPCPSLRVRRFWQLVCLHLLRYQIRHRYLLVGRATDVHGTIWNIAVSCRVSNMFARQFPLLLHEGCQRHAWPLVGMPSASFFGQRLIDTSATCELNHGA